MTSACDFVQEFAPGLKLLNSSPPIPGYRQFIGTYFIDGEKKALIDIGPRIAVPGVIEALAHARIRPEQIDYIVLTHIHIDHGGGAGTAVKSMTNARVVAHQRGEKHLAEPSRLWKASIDTLGDLARTYQEIEPVPAECIIAASDGMKLEMGRGITLEVLMTPGHAAHHMSLFEPRSRVLFAGDSAGIFSNGVLRLTTPPPFRLEEYLASVDRMVALDPAIICYAHFGFHPDAVQRLKAARAKVLLWHGLAQAGKNAGKTAEQIAGEIRRADPDLRYLDSLDADQFKRDQELMVTSIHGLMG